MTRRQMKRLLKKAWFLLAVGIVFAPSIYVVYNNSVHSKPKEVTVVSTATSKESHKLKSTIQNLLQEELSKHLQEKDYKESEDPVEIFGFPQQNPSFENCLNARNDESETRNFHELPTGNVIYSAFLDFRLKEQTFVRLISFLPAYGEITEMYCHFKGLKTYEFLTSVVEIEELGINNGYAYQGFLASCDLPEEIDSYTLCSVNISTEPESYRQNAENSKVIPLHVVDRRVNTKTYSLCVPPISGDISFARLVEFIELSQILGVSHFTFYNSKATDETLEILRYYKERGLVNVFSWKLPQYIASNIQDDGQTTALNDCLYRNMEMYEYVAFNGLDEFIVPFQDKTAPQIFHQFDDEDAAGYCFQSFTFYTDKSSFNYSRAKLFTQRFTSRANVPIAQLSRCIANLKRVFSLDLNGLTNPVETYYVARHLEPSLGYVFHYEECYNGKGYCSDSYQDFTMVKYRDELEKRVNETLNNLRRTGSI